MTASTRRPAGLPARREPLYSRAHWRTGALSSTGGREPVASACTVMVIRRVASVWKKGGSRRAGRPAGRRFGPVAIFPLDVNRNRAPAHLCSGVERPAHGTQSRLRPRTALAPAPAGAQPKLESSTAMGAAGARANPVRSQPALRQKHFGNIAPCRPGADIRSVVSKSFRTSFLVAKCEFPSVKALPVSDSRLYRSWPVRPTVTALA
jgi:hypothetical protein